jgi:hypothetical protein
MKAKFRDIISVVPVLIELIWAFTGKKKQRKKKAWALVPLLHELSTLWPSVETKLEALAEQDDEVRRFRQLIGQALDIL